MHAAATRDTDILLGCSTESSARSPPRVATDTQRSTTTARRSWTFVAGCPRSPPSISPPQRLTTNVSRRTSHDDGESRMIYADQFAEWQDATTDPFARRRSGADQTV